ncbi:hypothetical protein PspLS_05655, partial [Pyricularia sp. CBS 133598]
MTTLAEAHAIIFVAQHTSIPVPKIHCAFVQKGRKYIAMSRIRGDQLALGWHKRSEESRQKIFQQLRAVPQPNGGTLVGNVLGCPFFDPRLDMPFGEFGGPFKSGRKFHGTFLADHDVNFDDPRIENEDLVKLVRFYRAQGDNVVLTHADLSSINIMAYGDEFTGIC